MKKLDFLIENQWVSKEEAVCFPVYNPANGKRIAMAPTASSADVELACAAARRASRAWADVPVEERCGLLLKVAEKLARRARELAEAETEETGKPLYESEQIDLPLAIRAFEYFGKAAPAILKARETISLRDERFTDYTSYEPYGVACVIAPWNFPLHLLTRDICPALAAGNTVVAKPSSKTPVTAAMLGEIMVEAGFPKGVVNLLYGPGQTTGREMAMSAHVDVIAFTGSEAVGREIIRMSAEASVIKKTVVELGGKGAICVNRDADLEGAAASAVYGVCMNQGEVCCASSRCYVHRDVYEPFLQKVLERMGAIVMGDPLERSTDMGSLIDMAQLERVDGLVRRAVADGARLLTGGKRYRQGRCAEGCFYEPTVLVDVQEDMECMREEIFGPVLMAVKVDSIEEAVQRANASGYGLGAAIWSEDPAKLDWASHRLEAGTVWENHNITSMLEAPYGGIKNSGYGRQYGRQGLLEYVYVKNHMRFAGPPYADYYREK